jgi:tRNA pseudouridine65 synthase
MPLQILYQDQHYVAINKPHGLLVHRSKIAAEATEFALQLLRDQLGQQVHLVHRLDRKTSGVLLFGLSAEATKAAQAQWELPSTQKTYYALVRGYFPAQVVVDKPLINDRGKEQAAQTQFELVQQSEMPWPSGKFATSRYSLIRARPQTGRYHQIRKHCNHLRHPILGDRPHGCNKQNRLLKQKFGLTQMMLHAQQLNWIHPYSQQQWCIEAPFSAAFQTMQGHLCLSARLSG